MDKEDYVSFDVAKLLKDAGYSQDKVYCKYYGHNGKLYSSKYDCPIPENSVPAPHIWDVMKWCRDEKQILVSVKYDSGDEYYFDSGFYFVLHIIKPWGPEEIHDDYEEIPCSCYEDACNAGIGGACRKIVSGCLSKI